MSTTSIDATRVGPEPGPDALAHPAQPPPTDRGPSFGRVVVATSLLATVGLFALVTTAALAYGAVPASAMAVGLFSAAWGGGGFGVMFGGALYARQQAQRPAVPRARVAPIAAVAQ